MTSSPGTRTGFRPSLQVFCCAFETIAFVVILGAFSGLNPLKIIAAGVLGKNQRGLVPCGLLLIDHEG